MGQASGGKKYPTDFTTFEEFWSICRSIRRTDTRNEWISRIPGCRLHIKRDDGLSVALYLFFKKWLPIERLTKDMAFLDNGSGYTILQKLAEDHAVPETGSSSGRDNRRDQLSFNLYGDLRRGWFRSAEKEDCHGSVLTRDMLSGSPESAPLPTASLSEYPPEKIQNRRYTETAKRHGRLLATTLR